MPIPFSYQHDTFFCEQTELAGIAVACGTPAYVYSQATILDRYREYDAAFGDVPHKVCFAVKANGNLSVLRLLKDAGAGFDIVSGGELARVLRAGGDPASVVFSGVGKTDEEIDAALALGIHGFNCESEAELERLDLLARRRGVRASLALRVNPDVDAATHPYISTGMSEHKFGIDIRQVEPLYLEAAQRAGLKPEGVSCHIGSQLLDVSPLLESLDRLLALVDKLQARGLPIQYLDLGGGLGVPYRHTEEAPSIADYIGAVVSKVRGENLTVVVEPGRSIVAEAGVLLTKVLFVKKSGRKQFVVVDAAMNDLIRPALYGAHHDIVPLRQPHGGMMTADIVGPVCETGDFLARGREIPEVQAGDLLAVMTAGAYGFVQSSNYNARPRAVEVMVDGAHWRVIRRRETMEDLVRGEE